MRDRKEARNSFIVRQGNFITSSERTAFCLRQTLSEKEKDHHYTHKEAIKRRKLSLGTNKNFFAEREEIIILSETFFLPTSSCVRGYIV